MRQKSEALKSLQSEKTKFTHNNHSLNSAKSLYLAIFILISTLYNYLCWKNTFFPSEEASQYFPRTSTGSFLKSEYIFDGSAVSGNTLNVIPIGYFTGQFEDLLSSSSLILLTQFILNSLICFAAYNVLCLFIQKKIFCLMALTCLQFSFVITNYSSYFSKSLSFVFFCLVIRIYGLRCRIIPLIILMSGVSLLTLGMLSNLGATFVGWLAFPISIIMLRNRHLPAKEVRFKAFTMIVVTIIFQAPIIWKYYFSSKLIESYIDLSSSTQTRFGSNIGILTGDGNWMQFDNYGGTPYYNYVLPKGHWSYIVRILLFLLLVIYILVFTLFRRKLGVSNSLTSSYRIRGINVNFRAFDLLILFISGLLLAPVEEISFLDRFARETFLTAFRDPWMKFEGIFYLLIIARVFATIEVIFSELESMSWAFKERIKENKRSQKRKTRLYYENRRRTIFRSVGAILLSLQVGFTPLTNLSHQLSFEGPSNPAFNFHSKNFDVHKSEAKYSAVEWVSSMENKSRSEPIICVLAPDSLGQAASKTFLFYSFERLRDSSLVSRHTLTPKEHVYFCSGKRKDSVAKILNCDYSRKFIQATSRICYRKTSKLA